MGSLPSDTRVLLRYRIREYFSDQLLDEQDWQWIVKALAQQEWAHPAARGKRSRAIFPPDMEWVLRNLTLREYIRLSVLFNDVRLAYFHPLFVCGFVDVLFHELIWMADLLGVIGGRWAGHAFDITDLDETLADIQADPSLRWNDASTRYVGLRKELTSVWIQCL
jgi:hypothetical protein